jgi:hypothetical protein
MEESMGNRHPSNGPSCSKATYKAGRHPEPASSLERQQVAEEQSARDSAKTQEFNKMGGATWAQKYMQREVG